MADGTFAHPQGTGSFLSFLCNVGGPCKFTDYVDTKIFHRFLVSNNAAKILSWGI